jgi:hypothetical protein
MQALGGASEPASVNDGRESAKMAKVHTEK